MQERKIVLSPQWFSHGIHPRLVKAYRETNYVVFGASNEIVLKIGRVSRELSDLMNAANVASR